MAWSDRATCAAARAPGRHRGFTLLELLVTVAIIAVLSTVALPLAELSVKRSREQELRAALREIRTALDAYKQAVDDGRIARKADESGYPPSLAVLVDGVQDIRSAKRQRIFFLRRLPRDPLHPDPKVPASETWGLRAYESPPDRPRAGRDVYDVHSLSEGTGLNGIPYRRW